MKYSIDDVRGIAERASYKEIDFNSLSRVISFRRDTTRINVYYSTGTVGTCLNHPVKGKTQLFRRNVGIDELEQIFFEPRTHTGKGYYRKHESQKWKTICDNTGEAFFECDTARRWRYVTHASGLTHDESEIQDIVDWFEHWHSVCWGHNQAPDLKDMPFSCGTGCGFTNMILATMREILGESIRGYRIDKDWKIADEDNFKFEGNLNCAFLPFFLEEHEADISELQNQLQTFRKDIQIEILLWVFSLFYCGHALFTANDLKLVQTKHSKAVYTCHRDYGKLMYSKKTDLCLFHGVK